MYFRFLNIPVSIQPTFWVFLLIFCFVPEIHPWQMFLLALVLFFSLLFHEYGHALAAQKLGRPPEITLEGFGGYASYDGRGLSEKLQVIITLTGPLFTALLIGLSYFLLRNQYFESIFLKYLFYYTMRLNTYWLIVNLSPLQPLDGGKIAEYLLKKWFGPNKGRQFSLILGNIIAAVGASYFLINGSYMFAYLFLFHGWKNLQTYTAEYTKRRPSPFQRYNEALQALEENELEKSKLILNKLIKSKDEYIKIRSLESLAQLLDRKGEEKKAYRMLRKIPLEKLHRGKWLLCKLAYTQGNYDLFQKFSTEIYNINPTLETAELNAKAFSQLQNYSHAIAWLQTAVQFEEAKTKLSLDDSAFAPIQRHPEFLKLHEKLNLKADLY